jgi:hypothetical protein
VFYRLEEDVYLSGIPAPETRDWLANVAAKPQFTLHLKHRVVADLRLPPRSFSSRWSDDESSRSLSSSSIVAGVRMMTDGPRPFWMSGWRRVRWPK